MNETRTLRVAVPSEQPGGLEASLSPHFGRCPGFTIVEVKDDTVGDVFYVPNGEHGPGGCMAPVLVLGDHRVDALVVRGIGGRPYAGCMAAGIQVFLGTGETVAQAVDELRAGRLSQVPAGGLCQH
jgi:predicted Fe-Mo cluster-binding NifX family protein